MGRYETMLKHFEAEKDWAKPRIEEGIEKNRKADNAIRVVDGQGRPVSGVTVSCKQRNHSFLHGANCFMVEELETEAKNKQYRKDFANIFNQATIPFYWADLEPQKGMLRFEKDSPKVYRRPAPDLCMEFCRENNITPKLHCLNYDQWSPMWLPMHDVPLVRQELERRIREIAGRYSGSIHCMEVINETLCGFYDLDYRHSTDLFWEDDIISWSFKTARKYLPKNELVINEATKEAWSAQRNARSWYALSIRDAIQNGAEIDAIGLQYHMFHKAEEEEALTLPYYDPKRLFHVLDTYERLFKLPIQITEVTIPAYSNSAEDEALQARVIDELYSLWFSHPAVEMITYWNLVDGYAAFAEQGDMTSGENYYYGGLLRFDFTRKPAYDMIEELFKHRWHTESTGETNGQGCSSMRGFKGDYEVTLTKNGVSTVHICKLEGGETTLVL